MPQAHTLTAPTSSRAHRLTPVVVIITAGALFAAALIYATVNDTPTPKHSAVNVSESSASTARPDESKVAAAIAADLNSAPASVRPDESKIAANLTFPGIARKAREATGQPASSRPDETAVAAAIAGP